MPRRFIGSRVFGAASGDRLFIEKDGSGLATVIYQPSPSKLRVSKDYAADHEKAKRKLLEIGGPKGWLSIYPLNTLPTHADADFLQPKYERIVSVTLEGFNFEIPDPWKIFMPCWRSCRPAS